MTMGQWVMAQDQDCQQVAADSWGMKSLPAVRVVGLQGEHHVS